MGALREDDHLPFPVPSRSFAISQEWRDLTFMHWRVDPKRLQQHLPDGLAIDFFDGEAYVGVIPFMMKNVHPKGLVSVPGISTFAEFNVRTYVVKDGQHGVFFLTLDAKSLVTCLYANRAYGLAYRYAKARVKRHGDALTWTSRRSSDGAELIGSSMPSGPPQVAAAGSLEHFLSSGTVCTRNTTDAYGEATFIISHGDFNKQRYRLRRIHCSNPTTWVLMSYLQMLCILPMGSPSRHGRLNWLSESTSMINEIFCSWTEIADSATALRPSLTNALAKENNSVIGRFSMKARNALSRTCQKTPQCRFCVFDSKRQTLHSLSCGYTLRFVHAMVLQDVVPSALVDSITVTQHRLSPDSKIPS